MDEEYNWCKSCTFAMNSGFPSAGWPCITCADNCIYGSAVMKDYPHYYTSEPQPKNMSRHDFVMLIGEKNKKGIEKVIKENFYTIMARKQFPKEGV